MYPDAMPIRLGTQGWNYDAWVGPFYPPGTRPAEYLTVYARAFDTVEVDSTFYAAPTSKTIHDWAARVPEGFTFALKLPKEISHEKRLVDDEGLAPVFFDRARELGTKLGPILIQLGPDFPPEERPALARFLSTLPHDLRFAVEFRHRGWIHRDAVALLKDHNVALALTDARWIPRKTMLALAEHATADFAYVRWMGPNREITDFSRIQFDRGEELDAWSRALRVLEENVKDIWGFANNHFAGHSPATARDLQARLGQKSVAPEQLRRQGTLF
jgi:uncharacterized protein YecE (DUF72 family)